MQNIYTNDRGQAFRLNDLVVIEGLLGVADKDRIGRLVQVRKGKGAFMSDVLFVRRCDGSLMAFHNVIVRHAGDRDFEEAFYRSNGREPPVVPEQPPLKIDTDETEYLLGKEYPEVGFVIEEPKQPDDPKQSFAMTITSKA